MNDSGLNLQIAALSSYVSGTESTESNTGIGMLSPNSTSLYWHVKAMQIPVRLHYKHAIIVVLYK